MSKNRLDFRSALLVFGTACSMLFAPASGSAQPSSKVARVGWVVSDADPKASPRMLMMEGLRAGLREKGWIEGRNLVLEVRAGDRGAAAAIAKGFVDGKVDLLLADGVMFTGVRSEAGATPIVFTTSGDPVEAKWVSALARPGGNVTGMTTLALDLEVKRLELLKEVKPAIARVAVLANERHPGYRSQLAAAQAAASQLGLALHVVNVRSPSDLEAAFNAILQASSDAILLFHDSVVSLSARSVAEFSERRRIPAVAAWSSYVEAGNLLSYGPNEKEFFHRVAAYIDRILRGTKPSELPVELPTRFELAVNRKAAGSLGLVLPQPLLLRADRVID